MSAETEPARTIRALVFGGVVCVAPLAAQDLRPQAYLLNVPLAAAEGPLSESGVSHLARARLMIAPSVGPLRLDVAYEHLLTVRVSGQAAGSVAGYPGTSGMGAEWLPLQGTIHTGSRVVWRHRVDRMALSVVTDAIDVTAGRQTISWATTVMLTPADPFQPFDPADPFRTYRGGVDAFRARLSPGPFSSVEIVGRIADTPLGRTRTALGRWSADWGRIGVSAWGGVLHDRLGGSAGVTFTWGGAVWRAEASVRETVGDPVVRAAMGVDRSFEVNGRTLYVMMEYQHDGFGARRSEDYAAVLASEPAARGELQTLGRDVAALMVSYAVHPLATLQVLALGNLRDPSALLSPTVSVSISNASNILVGGFLGVGSDLVDSGVGPGSEFGVVPPIGYVSWEFFF